MDLGPLYRRAIDHYKEFESERWIVKNSIPVLYFGDVAAYSASKLKVVTVGNNPSYHEFDESKYRFGHYDQGSLDPMALERSFSAYFSGDSADPYSDWFDRSFETLLQPMGSSFYRKPPRNTALHTDICTPLATNPTWSKLTPKMKSRLQGTGLPLWRELMERLEPHLILISVSQRLLRALDLSWRAFSPFDLASDKQEMRIAELGKSKIVWGRGPRMPFIYLKKAQRPKAANAILREAGLA